MSEVRFCKDCKWSQPESGSEWNLRCINPYVNKRDQWALAGAGKINGSNCMSEREKGFISSLGSCGMKGKLWEMKDE